MIFFRILRPDWRFFDRVGARPRALGLRGDQWVPLFTPPRRRWWRVIFNPAGNLHHARQNLTQRLLEEAMVSSDVGELISYRLLAHAAEARGFTRFKLVANDEDVLISEALR